MVPYVPTGAGNFTHFMSLFNMLAEGFFNLPADMTEREFWTASDVRVTGVRKGIRQLRWYRNPKRPGLPPQRDPVKPLQAREYFTDIEYLRPDVDRDAQLIEHRLTQCGEVCPPA